MRTRIVAALAVASFSVFACRDTPRETPTDPGVDLSFAKGTGGACDAGVSRTAKAQLMDLLSGAALKQGQDYWNVVVGACSANNPDAANGPLMVYVNYLRGLYPTPLTNSQLFRTHLNTAFAFVGYPTPNITGAQLDSAIVQVILPTGGTREYFLPHLGAFKLPEQDGNGDPRGHLFVMQASGPGCLSVDNLQKFADCVELTSFPTVSPKFSPGIQVGICIPETISGIGLALGHETNGGTEVAGELNFPSNCHPPEEANGSWLGGPKEFFKRVAWVGKKTLLPSKAYATDKGIGGIGGALSPFGALNAQIFAAEFNTPPNTIGQPPVLVNGNYTFSSEVVSPGTILVQNSLGNLTGPLVVLSQGGGNCQACGQLRLTAHFFSASGNAADDGVYEVNWTSVQASPSVKGAPFVVRASDGKEIARVSYVTVKNSQNRISYNGSVLNTVPWVRNASQTFTVIVNLNTGKTSLKVNGVEVAANKNFVDAAASNLASVGAEFTGIDSGIMGWDQIGVRRIPDQPQPGS